MNSGAFDENKSEEIDNLYRALAVIQKTYEQGHTHYRDDKYLDTLENAGSHTKVVTKTAVSMERMRMRVTIVLVLLNPERDLDR